jgi:HAAS
VTSGDPRHGVLRALAAELHCGPRARRRILCELSDHLDDAVDDLRRAGVPANEAIEQAVNRLGDAEAIASAFADSRTEAGRWSSLRTRRSLAWVAVGAMSVVMACAAEVPQASGAKAPARVTVPAQHLATRADHPTSVRRPTRLKSTFAHSARARRGGRG